MADLFHEVRGACVRIMRHDRLTWPWSLTQDVALVRGLLLAEDFNWTCQDDGKRWSQLKHVAAALQAADPATLERLCESVNGNFANARLIPVVASALGILPDAIKRQARVMYPGQAATPVKYPFYRPQVSAPLSNTRLRLC